MKSNKQRRAEIVARRKKRAEKAKTARPRDPRAGLPPVEQTAPCNPSLLAVYNSYGTPTFVRDGYYTDTPFECAHCQQRETWRATQQKWWYEVAKGNVESRARLCNPCRRAERARRTEARRVHLEGVARKQAAKRRPR
jgi:hypothetical protein